MRIEGQMKRQAQEAERAFNALIDKAELDWVVESEREPGKRTWVTTLRPLGGREE